MLIKVQKWGNSLALRIPKSFANEIQLKNGSNINLSIAEGKLIIEPVDEKKYKLEELLEEVKETNLHKEYSFGKTEGKEIW
ncbi:AbrB/MazE/SpoVT family DNA-binding domain-containing protein [Dethiobacter alkaliphilus]|uniref:AbrB/MazE/SpoVT family DNA-binding domain-containing protein n=1 Tax=Dethiobacter alkaliphilus TaxID=427926 RepID=UPI002225CBC5|nr:AbrB/MazE/SpoVT family DNA-binding domain-containing protein [Dethiobacter alkaliphilus]MCW3488856.1 AbrB/MazE/SpoVT family DNA-binding domain-containing protein [Dethiobacter alkaliphilus]